MKIIKGKHFLIINVRSIFTIPIIIMPFYRKFEKIFFTLAILLITGNTLLKRGGQRDMRRSYENQKGNRVYRKTCIKSTDIVHVKV